MDTDMACLLFALPRELFLLVINRLRLGDLYALSVTCSSMTAVVEPLLYKRAADDNIAEIKFYYAAVNGSANAVLKFLRTGTVSLAAFERHQDKVWRFADYDESFRSLDKWRHLRKYGVKRRSAMKRYLLDSTVHPFLAAAALGHIDVVKVFLSSSLQNEGKGLSIDFEEYEGRTALSYAVEKCQLGMVRFLLRQGAMIARPPSWSSQRHSPLFAAVEIGNKKALKIMMSEFRRRRVPEKEIRKYSTLLCYEACAKGVDEIVEYLFLHEGLNVNTPITGNRRLLYYASSRGHLSTVKLLVEYGARLKTERDTGVLAATINHHLEIVKFLLDSGCSVADGGLHACAMWRYAEDVDLFDRPYIHNLLKAKGFRKEACRHNCWSMKTFLGRRLSYHNAEKVKAYVANVTLADVQVLTS